MKKLTLHVSGMHCVSCETLIERELKGIPGVKRIRVSHKDGRAEIEAEDGVLLGDLEAAVRKCGYGIDSAHQKGGKGAPVCAVPERPDYFQMAMIAIGLGTAFLIASRLRITKIFPDIGGDVSFWLALPIGIAASLSTCLAMTGGIVLGFGALVKTNGNGGGQASLLARSRPHLIFHLGRVGGFFLLGGLLGLIGSKINYSLTVTGYLTMVVAAIMGYVGLQILGIVPSITRFGLHLPKSWGEKISGLQGSRSQVMPLLLGALTFFLPCGFTQSMQVAAAASRSFWSGGMIMAMFALGTLPVLFSIGLGSTYANKSRTKFLFRVIGVAVVFFALYSFKSGWVLTGGLKSLTDAERPSAGEALMEKELPEVLNQRQQQVVKMQVDWGFDPTEFRVKQGVPVRWEIYGKNISGCSNEIIVPSLGIRKALQIGLNVVEFTPTEKGTIPFSCWMGMLRGKFIVE
jgi:sulfite exporter TauE/SafE/copper chaperone CopZ